MERIGEEESEERAQPEFDSGLRGPRESPPTQRPQQETEIALRQATTAADMDDMLQKLKVLFGYYASFGDRLNVTNLKASKFHKLMQDARVETNPACKKRIDLIFCSQNKNMPNMGFDTFLNTLPLVARVRYPAMTAKKQGSSAALNFLLSTHILPLYERLAATQAHLRIQQKCDVEVTETVVQLLRSVEEPIYEVYAVYLPWELSTPETAGTVANRTIKGVFTLLNEFEICPTILNKTVVFNVLSSVINDQNPPPTAAIPQPQHAAGGTVLTFAKFIYLIVKLAYFAYDTNPEFSLAERLCFLLERMELSDGFANLEKKTNRPHIARTSLLPSDALINKVMQEVQQEKRQGSGPKLADSEALPAMPGDNSSDEEERTEDQPPESRWLEQLRSLFQKYCAYGEPLNTTRLKGAKFLKLLRDCGVVSSRGAMRQVDADLIYARVTGVQLSSGDLPEGIGSPATGASTSRSKRTVEGFATMAESGSRLLDFNRKKGTQPTGRMMDFDQFLAGLRMVVQRITPDMDPEQGLVRLAEESLFPLESAMASDRAVSNDTLMTLMELIKEKGMSRFLGVAHKALHPFYKDYSDPKDSRSRMTLEGFMKFCTDFGIFPDLVTKPRLYSIFYTIASIYSTGAGAARSENDPDQACIDDQFFVQAIALCALELPYGNERRQPSNFEKVFWDRAETRVDTFADGTDVPEPRDGDRAEVARRNQVRRE